MRQMHLAKSECNMQQKEKSSEKIPAVTISEPAQTVCRKFAKKCHLSVDASQYCKLRMCQKTLITVVNCNSHETTAIPNERQNRQTINADTKLIDQSC